MKGLQKLAFLLLVIGGLNWLVIGIFGRDYVDILLGSAVARIVYVLVGLSAVVQLFGRGKSQPSGMPQ